MILPVFGVSWIFAGLLVLDVLQKTRERQASCVSVGIQSSRVSLSVLSRIFFFL